MNPIYSDLLDQAGLYAGRARQLIEAIARLGRQNNEGVIVWSGTNTELAAELQCTPRTLRRVWKSLDDRALPWLAIEERSNQGRVIKLDSARTSLGHRSDTARTLLGHGADIARTSLGHCSDTARTSDTQQPRAGAVQGTPTHAPATLPKSLLLEDSLAGLPSAPAHEPTHTREASWRASQPAASLQSEQDTEQPLSAWLASELERRGGELAQDTTQPPASALTSAIASLIAELGDEASAKRYVSARLLDYELRPAAQRPATLARLIGWLVRDASRPDLKAAATGADQVARAAPHPERRSAGARQAYTSEGYAEQLEAAIAYGTRNQVSIADEPPSEDPAYELQCQQTFKVALWEGVFPAGTSYSRELLEREGMLPDPHAFRRALRTGVAR